jgi:hypothetical protein
VIDVALATANFSRVKLASLLVTRNTARAPAPTTPRPGQFEQDNYATAEQGHEEVNDDNEQQLYAYTIDSEVIVARRARRRAPQLREARRRQGDRHRDLDRRGADDQRQHELEAPPTPRPRRRSSTSTRP